VIRVFRRRSLVSEVYMRPFRLICLLLSALASMPIVAEQVVGVNKYVDIDYDVSGVVYDEDGKQPLQDAYVVLLYKTPGAGPGPGYGATSLCVRTKGQFTDGEGRFRFRRETLDGMILMWTHAVKPGYLVAGQRVPAPSSSGSTLPGEALVRFGLVRHPSGDRRQLNSEVAHGHAYLYQEVAQVDCWRAEYREDAAAGIPFLEILRGEFERFYIGPEQPNAVQRVREIDQNIRLLKSLPSRNGSEARVLPRARVQSPPDERAEWPGVFKRSKLRLTGTVFDAASKAPIEGAYVIAIYKELRSGPAATRAFCVGAKVTHTGKDGTYAFPVEKRDGYSPFETAVIYPGHYTKHSIFPESEQWQKQDAVAYSGRDFYLAEQNPANPNWRFGLPEKDTCREARSAEDKVAADDFDLKTTAEQDRLKRQLKK
jgi:hypothetical protein